ncbi:MAG: ABC transporter permease [Gammaproteobacteria bacterium]|nr:ABC transporter permease [Gammaproteobacteria bacterium]
MNLIGGILQIIAVTVLNVRSMGERISSSAVSVIGIAGVVMVFIGILSVAEGFRATLTENTPPENVMVLRSSATSELDSGLSYDQTQIVAQTPGVAVDPENNPLASAELFVVVDVPRRTTGTGSNVPLRGVQPGAFSVRDMRIVEGRNFTPGLNEIIVGQGAAAQFAGLEVGNQLTWGSNTWNVVGIFEAKGGIAESEIWADVRVVQDIYRRGNTYQTMRVKLESPEAFTEFKDTLTADPRMNVQIKTEREFYAEQSRALSAFITYIGFSIAVLMGLGAMFGAVNTMYTAVSNRAGEIATLRALGFGRFPVLLSILLESLFLGLLGGLIGGVAAYLIFNGYQVSTLSFTSFSQVTFAFAVTPELLVRGATYAILLGFIGGILPSIRAARLPIATALREL